jgi:hypothetical protein
LCKKIMKKAISVKRKSGRPATGIAPLMGFRADPVIRAAIVKWAEYQPDNPTLSEAIRRLVQLGLTVKSKRHPKNEAASQGTKQRARELAGTAIDKMTDAAASMDDQGNRKRRLIGGPEEFQSVRRDRPSRK